MSKKILNYISQTHHHMLQMTLNYIDLVRLLCVPNDEKLKTCVKRRRRYEIQHAWGEDLLRDKSRGQDLREVYWLTP